MASALLSSWSPWKPPTGAQALLRITSVDNSLTGVALRLCGTPYVSMTTGEFKNIFEVHVVNKDSNEGHRFGDPRKKH